MMNNGRLQTAEHILARVLEDGFPGSKVAIAVFDHPMHARVDISSPHDLRTADKSLLEHKVGQVISRGLPVVVTTIGRKAASEEFDLSRVPESVQEVRIVEIRGFDRRPCKDPHVVNTADIGVFCIQDVLRVGKDRYRFVISVRNV